MNKTILVTVAETKEVYFKILVKQGFKETKALTCAEIFTETRDKQLDSNRYSVFMYNKFISLIFICLAVQSFSQENLITNLPSRRTISLNGKWQYIIDPYETGFYNYRWTERNENDREAYWNSDIPDSKTDRKEHGYSDKYTLNVPG